MAWAAHVSVYSGEWNGLVQPVLCHFLTSFCSPLAKGQPHDLPFTPPAAMKTLPLRICFSFFPVCLSVPSSRVEPWILFLFSWSTTEPLIVFQCKVTFGNMCSYQSRNRNKREAFQETTQVTLFSVAKLKWKSRQTQEYMFNVPMNLALRGIKQRNNL